MSANAGSAGREIRIGLIGCGDIARRVHIPGLRSAGARVTRFASVDIADAEAAAAEAADPDAMTTDDWRHVVASAHIDAVDICTPNHLHAEMALAAVEAGKHVLVESPMALTAAEADGLLKAAARKGVVLVPALSVRFIAPYAALVGAALDGRIGRITGAEVAFGHAGPDVRNPAATWYLDRERSGGGPLLELGTAQVDLLRLALGGEPTEVSAVTLGRRGEVEERAEARVTFADGRSVQLRAGWAGVENQVVLRGTDGTLRLDPRGNPLVELADGSLEQLPFPTSAPSIEEMFVAAVARGEAPPVSAADGRAAVATIAAAYESARTGATVGVQPARW